MLRILFRSSYWRYSIKMLLLKVPQNSLESVCVRAYTKSGTQDPIRSVGPETRDPGRLWHLGTETWSPEDGNRGYYDKRDPIPWTRISSQTWDQKELWSKWSTIHLRNRILVMNISFLQSTGVDLVNYIVSFLIATSLI